MVLTIDQQIQIGGEIITLIVAAGAIAKLFAKVREIHISMNSRLDLLLAAKDALTKAALEAAASSADAKEIVARAESYAAGLARGQAQVSIVADMAPQKRSGE